MGILKYQINLTRAPMHQIFYFDPILALLHAPGLVGNTVFVLHTPFRELFQIRFDQHGMIQNQISFNLNGEVL